MRRYLFVLIGVIAVFGLGVIATASYYQGRYENVGSVSSKASVSADAQPLKTDAIHKEPVEPQKESTVEQDDDYEEVPIEPIIYTEQDRLRAELLKSRNQPREIGDFIDADAVYQRRSGSGAVVSPENEADAVLQNVELQDVPTPTP